MRNSGVGKAIFALMGEIALARDCGRVEWSVLKWNTSAIAFYEQMLGAKPQVEWQNERIEGREQIKALTALKDLI